MEDKKQPIVVKKIIQGHGHHGGSWKVAFADFATAMMAFFMVLWLVGQTDAQKRGGIAEYFQNPSMVRGHSEAPTGSLGPGGAGMSLISFGTSIEVQKTEEMTVEKIRDGGMAYVSADKVREQRRLEELLKELREEIGSSPSLQSFKDQMVMEITPNGLRVHIVDRKDRPMFDSGSANLKPYTREILYQLAKTINAVRNKISISGHTDASPLSKRNGSYTNWELSSDRANAARRALIEGGLKADKIERVIGLASTSLLDKEHPHSPSNRRITIVVMKQEVSELAKLEDEMNAIPTELIQQNIDLDKIRKGQHDPLSSDEMELEDDKVSEPVETDPGNGLDMELDLHGMHKSDKKPVGEAANNQPDNSHQHKQQKSAANESRPRERETHDPEVIIRNKGEAKSFIQLPPIIDPSLLPNGKQ